MKKLFILLLGTSFLLGSAAPLMAAKVGKWNDLTSEIPMLEVKNDKWEKVPDVAQYKGADWNNVVGLSENVSLKEAMDIAESHPEITYFFIMKGNRMVLENKNNARIFKRGDAVFFTGEPWWGEAKGFADGYIKKPAVAN